VNGTELHAGSLGVIGGCSEGHGLHACRQRRRRQGGEENDEPHSGSFSIRTTRRSGARKKSATGS
jgi:hypothetical protein